MIELDGKQYVVQTPQENTTDMLNTINGYCIANDIRNSKDEVVQIAASPTNPLYMILWGLGYLVAIIQKLIYNLGCGMSIPNASEAQLLNLADLAGISRGKASRTTIDLLCYASSDYECTIEVTDTVTINNVQYAPAFDLTIPANGVGHIVLVAQEEGSFVVSEDVMTDFDAPIANLRTFKQYASIPGKEQESVSSLRERLQRRTYSGSNIDAAADAIRSLDGVTLCSIYFNDSNTQTTMINGISVVPRSALLFVQGYNADIAKTFYQHLTCKTNPATAQRTLQQNYVTHAGQTFPVYIITPAQIDLHIIVYVGKTVQSDTITAMKDAIMSLAKELTAGQSVTSNMILDTLRDDFDSYDLQGAELGENTVQTSYIMTPEADELYVFNAENIIISMPEVATN